MTKKLSKQTQIEICKDINSKLFKDKHICSKYGITKGVLYRLKLEKDKILATNGNGDNNHELNLNEMVYSSFCTLREKNLPINGPILKLIALKIATEIGKNDFKASNGWLQRFKSENSISFKKLSGEAKSANKQDAINFIDKIEGLIARYGADNVFNCDETALFYRSLSNKSFVSSSDQAIGTKTLKDRLSLLLCCSLTGEKYVPLVIGKSKSPRALKNIDIHSLDIEYDSSPKAWMNRGIF